MIFLWLIICVTYVQYPAFGSRSISIPLSTSYSFVEQLRAEGRLRNVSYSQNILGKKKPHQITNDSIPLYKFLDTQLYAVLGVGHPAQPIPFILDTAWGDSWVIGSKCSFYSVQCAFKKKFNEEASTTFQQVGKRFNVQVEDGNITGVMGKDTIYLPHSNVTNHTFGVVSSLPISYVFQKASGIIGLAQRPELGDISFVDNFLKHNHIPIPIFSIYVNRIKETEHAGSIVFGAMDKKHYNTTIPILYQKVIHPMYWMFSVTKIQLVLSKHKVIDLCSNQCTASIDTSTTSISGPAKNIDFIHEKIKAKYIAYDKYVIPCEKVHKLRHINFVLGTKNYTLRGPNYTQMVTQSGVEICVSALTKNNNMAYPDNATWSLGGAFLDVYYTVFDVGKRTIGFGLKIH